jgi:cell division protein ZapB
MPVNIDISSLEAKVDRVIAFCEALRADNHALRERLAGLENEKLTLTERMGSARERLENIMDKLPAE